MSDTPKTDAKRSGENHFMGDWVDANFACQLERELNAANQRIKRLEQSAQEIDKEWFQVIESILGFHPVSMTEALRIGIERIKKQRQRIKRLEELGHELRECASQLGWTSSDDSRWIERAEAVVEAWDKAKEDKL